MRRQAKSENLFGWFRKKKSSKAKSKAKGPRGRVTYHRDVATERRELVREAKAERARREREQREANRRAAAYQREQEREERAWKKRKDQEQREIDRREAARLLREERQDGKAELRAKRLRREADARDRRIEREMREQGLRNPGCANTRKSNVSDRAKRYRANQPGCRPSGVKKCKLCGSKSDVMVDHVDGNESNGKKSNLRWLCRSCNNTLGAEMARTGQGRRTVQYNPAHKGAQTLGEYMQAVLQHTRGSHDAAGKIIHDTPKSKRREFAAEIWERRQKRAEGSGGYDDAPDWVTNPQVSTEYRLGYNLGQTDRQSAQLPKTAGELYQIFAANFGGQHPNRIEEFQKAYHAGYGKPQAGPDGPARSNPKRRNPEGDSEEYEQAKRIAELFHGRPIKEEIEVTDEIHSHDWYAYIGPLVELRVKALKGSPFKSARFKFNLKGDAAVSLMTSPDGRQFYLRGGDQEIDLDSLGMAKDSDWFRDHMAIGLVTYIAYRDRKKFHGFTPTEYNHKIGSALDSTGTRHIQATNVKPVLEYDTLSHKLRIVGGLQKVEVDQLVEDMSPGIVL